MKIAIIGNGKMGGAFASGLSAHDFTVVATKRGDDNRATIASADVIILAVKPKDLGTLLCEIAGAVPAAALVISIVAGIRIATIQSGLRHSRVMRAMPNLPAKIGRSVTGWYAPSEFDAASRECIRSVLVAVGSHWEFATERDVDTATGCFGSTPAFLVYVLEAFMRVAVQRGIEASAAQCMVLETVLGTAQFLIDSNMDFGQFIAQVRTPNGTTNAGLLVFDAGNVAQSLEWGVEVACNRAEEIGK